MSFGGHGVVRWQKPPMQLCPIEHECPQLPQLLLSLMNVVSLTQLPMHWVYPAAHEQDPPVHDSEAIRHELPQRPQLLLSIRKSP